MPNYEYRVVPFLADVPARDKQGAEKAAGQLQSVIDANVGNGWEFYRADQIQVVVRPGCLSALFGGRASTIGLDMLSFRHERP